MSSHLDLIIDSDDRVRHADAERIALLRRADVERGVWPKAGNEQVGQRKRMTRNDDVAGLKELADGVADIVGDQLVVSLLHIGCRTAHTFFSSDAASMRPCTEPASVCSLVRAMLALQFPKAFEEPVTDGKHHRRAVPLGC